MSEMRPTVGPDIAGERRISDGRVLAVVTDRLAATQEDRVAPAWVIVPAAELPVPLSALGIVEPGAELLAVRLLTLLGARCIRQRACIVRAASQGNAA